MLKQTGENSTIDKIIEIKNKLGKEVVILTHHYQRKEVVDLGDHKGDSFDLSQKAAVDENAKTIIFCGVHFMAESAAVLSQPHQTVQIPDMDAGCWMADMADIVMVERAWKEVSKVVDTASITPIVYMNADASIKAFCGRNEGLVCTSSNADAAFKWAFDRREKIFFFPDEHLGRNTGHKMGLKPDEMILWDPEKPLGGNTEDDIRKARVFLWKGYCLVHTRFTTEQIEMKRKEFPDARIIVHPECTREVVAESDASGSTSYIVTYVDQAPSGSTIVIGTEINLIERLALEYPDKNVIPLHRSLCPNMYKISPENLLQVLENIGELNVVTVPEQIKNDARVALDRMLTLA